MKIIIKDCDDETTVEAKLDRLLEIVESILEKEIHMIAELDTLVATVAALDVKVDALIAASRLSPEDLAKIVGANASLVNQGDKIDAALGGPPLNARR